MAIEVGAAYLSIVPSLDGFGAAIRAQVTPAIQQAAREMEEQLGEAARRAGNGLGEETERGAKSAKSSIAGLGVSIAAVAVIAGGIGQAMQKSFQEAKLRASFGFTPDEAKAAATTAGKVYAGAWGDSLEEVNQSVGVVMQSLKGLNLGAGASIEGLTTKALAFKGAFGSEVPDTIRAVSQMLRTGLVPDAQTAFDVLAVGFQNGSNKADDLLDTFNEYGTQFRKLGLDGPAAMGLISQAIQNGARDSDLAADALKEFSIRAIDGSKTTAQGFQMLGLNADTMAEKIAKGGSSAAGGLQLTLDKLRGIKDPALQAQAATALFGTQAEDLGQALFSMDPATASATNGLQNVAGASDRVTSAMNDATPPLEAFKREGMEAIGNAASTVLPALTGVLSAIQPYAGVIGSAVLALGGFVLVMKGVEAIQGAIATIQAFSLVTKISTAWTWLQVTAIDAAAAAQWLWNAAFIASPIGWIVLAIGLLVAAVIYAWTHFEGFRKVVIACWDGIKTAAEWTWNNVLKPAFDGIVVGVQAVGSFFLWLWNNAIKPAWDGISTAVGWAWNNVILPIFGAIQVYVGIVGAVFNWLWHNVISPVWEGIKLAFNIGYALVSVVFGLIEIAVKASAAVFMWLWHNVISPVWDGIKLAFNVGWALIQVVFGLIEIAIKASGAVFTWLWNNAVVPAWNGIKAAAQAAWTFLDTMVFKPIGVAVNAVGAVFTWLWNNAIVPAWNGIKTAISAAWSWVHDTVLAPAISWIQGTFGPPWNVLKTLITGAWDGIKSGISTAWNWVRDNVFNPIKTAITVDVPRAFDAGKEAIGKAWNGIRDAAKVPIKFVIETVINSGIIDNYNKLAKMFNVHTVDHVPLPAGFATGGLIRGPGTGTSDSILAQVAGGPMIRVSNGEYIVPQHAVRRFGIGFFDWLAGKKKKRLNDDNIRPGDGSEGLAFAAGGIVDFASDVWNMVTDPVKLIEAPINALISRIPGGGDIRDATVGMAKKFLGDMIGWVKGLVTGGGGIGGDVGKTQAFLQAQNGKPYIWAAAGPTGYDCSGIVSAAWNMMHGRNPYSHTFNTESEDPYFPIPGHGLFTAGWAHPGQKGAGASVGHTAGNLAGLAFESTGDHVRVGSAARSVDGFAHVGHYDQGGVLPPGITAVINASRKPEVALNSDQWRDMRAAANYAASHAAAGGGGSTYIIQPRKADIDARDLKDITDRENALARVGRSR